MANRLSQLKLILQHCATQPACPGSEDGDTADIEVTPRVSLFDQKVDIRVRGLPCVTKVTLRLVTCLKWRRAPVEFMSCGHYVTSPEGDLQLHRDASLGGTYSGLDPMGLFWSMIPSPAGPQLIRLVRRDANPIAYTLSVYLDHLALSDLASKDRKPTPVCSTAVTRLKMTADVQRIPVREGSVRGTLFLPGGEGPHPGVIDMYGGVGGVMEFRAPMLASHGFATLALAYSNYDDLPTRIQNIAFEYYEEAVSFLSSHKAVKGNSIGIVAISRGVSFATLMAVQCPQVKALVAINGPPFVVNDECYRRDGRALYNKVRVNAGKYIYTEKGIDTKDSHEIMKESLLPLWETSAHVLWFNCEDDHSMSPAWGEMLYSMYPEDKRHLIQLVHYPGAGHLLEPPYSPLCQACTMSFSEDESVYWGGSVIPHAAAQEDSWERILKFLKTHL